MAKSKIVGGISFSEEGYEKFVSLTKDKQLEKVYNSLNPKDMEQAELALKNVPNGGNINKGSQKQDSINNTSNAGGGDEAVGSKGSKIDTGKGKGA